MRRHATTSWAASTVAVAFPLLVACGSEGEGAGAWRAARQPIVGGTPSDASQESVVRLDEDGEFACTATMVAPNLVLTARHCVAVIDESGACGTFGPSTAAARFSVSVGANAKATGVKGKAVYTEASTDGCSTDLALVLLAADVPGAKIAPVRLDAAAVGEGASTVGYGDDGSFSGELGPRAQRAGLKVDAVGPAKYQYKPKSGAPIEVELEPGELATGESTCSGDSGGPLFDSAGRVIAVTSRGVDDQCVDRPSVYATVASHRALVEKAFAEAGHPLTPATPPPALESPSSTPAPPPSAPPAMAAAASEGSSDGCRVAPPSGSGAGYLVVALALLLRRRGAKAKK